MSRQLIVPDKPEAIAWARQFLERLRTTPDPLFGNVYWLDREGSRRVIIEMFKAYARTNVHNRLAVIGEAERGWDLPHEAIRELIIEYIDRDEPLGVALANYNQKLLSRYEPKVASTQKAHQVLRNFAIAHSVKVLVEQFGMPPRGRKGSASSVVANAMRGRGVGGQILTHRQVENIIKDYSHWAFLFPFFSQRLQALTA